MRNGSVDPRRIAVGVGLWLLLYLGLSTVLFGVFSAAGVAQPPGRSLPAVAFALGVVVTGLAFFAVVIDRLLFSREPRDFSMRQSVWVIVLVVLTVLSTAAVVSLIHLTPGDAVLFGIVVALPTTMVLFAAINFARYRSMEHRPQSMERRP